jgi:hypothetical protein
MVDSKTMQLKETYRGDFISVASYDDEPTSELRETAFFDVENG